MKQSQGNSTISVGLRSQFEKEVQTFAKQLEAFVSGEEKSLFGSVIEPIMPQGNTQDIVEKYVKLGAVQLQSEGVRRMRAQSIAKHTFSELLVSVMNELEKSNF